jgi:hypothetical protein
MTKKSVYQCVLDGSNVITHMRKGDDGIKAPNIVVPRFESAIAFFKSIGVDCKFFLDDATLQQAKKGKRPLVGDITTLQSLIDQNDVVIIKHDGTMAMFAITNEIPIVTNDQFKDWISGENTSKGTKDISSEDWKKLQQQNIGFKFAKDSNNFTLTKQIQSKLKSTRKATSKTPEDSNYLEKIRQRLESLDDQTKNQTKKITEIENAVINLGNLFEDFATSGTNSNSSALIPCKFEDEFGQSHLCLLGKNLHIWQDGKWIEIAIGGNTKLLD